MLVQGGGLWGLLVCWAWTRSLGSRRRQGLRGAHGLWLWALSQCPGAGGWRGGIFWMCIEAGAGGMS